MPQRLLVVGGKARPDAPSRPSWMHYEQAIVVELDLASGAARTVFRHQSAPDCMPEDGMLSHQFKTAGCLDGHLYLCANTEILVCRLTDFCVVRRITNPLFNDLHHVLPLANGRLLVVSTGLDGLLELSADGAVEQMWNVLGKDFWHRRQPGMDYRKIASTKPHEAHPNHVLLCREDRWVTRFHQRDVVRIGGDYRSIPVGGTAGLHDGVLLGDQAIMVTSVDGKLHQLDLSGCTPIKSLDVRGLYRGKRRPGWCRGLCRLPDETMLVGFSRLRPTLWTANLAWLRQPHKTLDTLAQLPARIAHVDLRGPRLIRDYDLGDSEISSIFSIHGIP